ncbi:MAG: glycosyl hydrolase family 28 protein [Duncaniella sp.]|nr:glycosyl hydrolase family 28 protein [Muribaculum sp.]MCM1255553.1 glycosyl hydrolase family 28 protein [Duncaniella sp.]
MKTSSRFILFTAALAAAITANAKFTNFPDGSKVSDWFNDTNVEKVEKLGTQYVITEHGVINDSTIIQTEQIQSVIDLAAANGGGVIVVPEGTFLSGSIFFKPGTHLHIVKNGKLKGSDAITHYQIVKTRLEGQTLDYFAALVNANDCDGFTISGQGIIDGNGHRFYDEFWLRRKVNRKCTNLEALRPRMFYASNSKDVTVSGITMMNSGFWTNHLYNCERVKYLGVTILAPTEGYPKGPSTDAIDLDVCNDVLISDCYMNVNDDGVCLKGGKGTYVDTIPGNGAVTNVIVNRCTFGKTNGGITFGSEAWNCSNVIMKDCKFEGTFNVVLFKMRPDTPQQFRNVLVDGATGNVRTAFAASTWTQFFNKVERDPMPASGIDNVVFRNCHLVCGRDFYKNSKNKDYEISNFTFRDIWAEDSNGSFDTSEITNCIIENVTLNGKKY